MAQCDSEKRIVKRTSHKELLKLEDKELLKVIRKVMMDNKAFTSIAYKKAKFIPFPTLKRRFKNIEVWQDLINYLHLNKEYQIATMKAKKKIITPAFIKNSVKESNEELLEMYKEFSKKIGAYNGASMLQLKKYGFKYSETVLLRRFGSWKNVKESCGYTFNLGTMYSKEEIVKLLMLAREKYGRRLSQKEINQDPDLPTLETVLKFFKTTKISSIWDELEKGMEKTTTDGKTYTLKEIKELLYKEYLEKGAPLTVVEIMEKTKEGKLPGKTTIYRHFKTQKIREIWKIVLEERESKMDKVRETFYKYWDKEKSDTFYKTLESSVLSYKLECLEKFIENIFKENPSVKRDEILRYTKNMDAFTDAEEFLIDFFKSTRTPEGDAVAVRLEDNPEEVERLLNGLLTSKKIRVKKNENEFIVWYL